MDRPHTSREAASSSPGTTITRCTSVCHHESMSTSGTRRWVARIAWAIGGAVVGGTATIVWLSVQHHAVPLPPNDLQSVWTWDTIGTWCGTIATVAVAVIAAIYTLTSTRRERRVTEERQRTEERQNELDALTLASEVQFRVRPVLGSNQFWTKWRVDLYTADRAPATDVELLVDGKPLGSKLNVLRMTKDSPWSWPETRDLDMPAVTTSLEEARTFIRSHVRERVEVRFAMRGYRFTRTAAGLEPNGKIPSR